MMKLMTHSSTIAYLRSSQAIRDRASQLFDLACAGKLEYFNCDLTQLESVAEYVWSVTQANYPDGEIPVHSRWRHFEIDGGHRLTRLMTQLDAFNDVDRAKALIDLVVISVLLDAGAGPDWQYQDAELGQTFTRSEGLAMASLDMFLAGQFSSDRDRPLQVDAIALQDLTEAHLATGFQVSHDNPLVGLSGRVALLQRLGDACIQAPEVFEIEGRPGNLIHGWLARSHTDRQDRQSGEPTRQLKASVVLETILEYLSSIWPGRLSVDGINLGDVWLHPALPTTSATSQLVPFHKLSQWLTYSLIEPLQWGGLTLIDLDDLTGLPEYRNGGLCMDLGLLVPKDRSLLNTPQSPGAVAIVEWRALTVICLDRIAATMRQMHALTAAELPLAKVLQGGTWTAGRQIATQLRQGRPPIQLDSDGTVF